MEKTRKKTDLLKPLPQVVEELREKTVEEEPGKCTISKIYASDLTFYEKIEKQNFKYLCVSEDGVSQFSPTNGILATFWEVLKTKTIFEIPVFIPGFGYYYLVCGRADPCLSLNRYADRYVQKAHIPVYGGFILCGIKKDVFKGGIPGILSARPREFSPKHICPIPEEKLERLLIYFADAFTFERCKFAYYEFEEAAE